MRSVNKGLSLVINEVIKWISEVMENDANQELVRRILRILNTHHSDLIQKAVNRNDVTTTDSWDFTSTTTDFNEKENNFPPCIQPKRRKSIEKNISNINLYKSNLDKVDKILQEHQHRNIWLQTNTRNNSSSKNLLSVNFAK